MHQDSPPEPTIDVFCLANEHTSYQWLIPFCRQRGLALTGFTTIADLAVSLAAQPGVALLIFADVRPQKGGFGALIDYLAGRLERRPKFICVAAADELKLRLDASRAGCAGFFTVPTDGDRLAAALKQLARSEQAQPNRVLVVDDVAVEAMIAAQVLRKAGFEVRELTDELKIIEAIRDFQPDLILMDLNMPNATGAELTTIIRDQDDSLLTPIVFLSGELDADIQRQTLRLGAEEFLTKPLDPKLLIETVTARIERSRSIRQRLDRTTQNDEATGLVTRRGFLRLLDSALHAPDIRRAGNGVLFVSIDDVAGILKKAGSGGEDMLLAHLGAVLRGQLRGDDIAARFGKFSFTLLAHCVDDAALRVFAVRLRRALCDQVIVLGSTELRIGASIGISSFGSATSDAITHISQSEAACYLARDQAAEGICLHRDAGHSGETQDCVSQVGARLEEAMAASALQLVFEPLMSLQQGAPKPCYRVAARVFGTYLDLVRSDPSLSGAVSADGTLRIAALRAIAKPSLIARIELWTMGKALEALATQPPTTQQPKAFNCRLFVHLSMSTLRLKRWLNWTAERLSASELSGDNLTLLIDNADLLTSLSVANEIFPALGKLGIDICVADFSTQPASQKLLRDYRVAAVIPSLDLIADQAQRALLSQMIAAAHANETSVIADGVGDGETLSRVWELGTDFVIGPFVQPPSLAMNFDFDAS